MAPKMESLRRPLVCAITATRIDARHCRQPQAEYEDGQSRNLNAHAILEEPFRIGHKHQKRLGRMATSTARGDLNARQKFGLSAQLQPLALDSLPR